jgi:putative acetyltransferase
MIRILPAREVELPLVRDLFREYERFIGVSLCFQNFEAELAALPGEYVPPAGRLLLAKVDDELAGCIALRKLSDTTCEMKRLFARPSFQGQGLGRKLATAIIEEARSIGYSAMRLDTLPSMKAAVALYTSLGFKAIAPYNANPVDGTLFFECALRPGESGATIGPSSDGRRTDQA